MRILFFGDIVAKAGRQALAKVLPAWREKYSPEVIIGNIENLAHGKGVTASTLDELLNLGFTAFTSGDHIFARSEAETLLQNKKYALLRPANYPSQVTGKGFLRLSIGSRDLLLINLMGQVFLPDNYESPFHVVDSILQAEQAVGNLGCIIVDIHAEATSEKVALGWYLDGRVSAVVGTHTHVPTADEWVLPKGTAYVSDVGMTGIRESVIGVKTEIILQRFLTQLPARHEPAETGTVVVTAMLINIDSTTTKANSIERLTELVTIA